MEREAKAALPRLQFAMKVARPEMLAPLELEFDPNSVDPRDPTLSVARLPEGIRTPKLGERVTLVQPDDDDYNFVGVGRVARVNPERRLVYLAADWPSFRAVGTPTVVTERPTLLRDDVHGWWRLRASMGSPGAGYRERLKESV